MGYKIIIKRRMEREISLEEMVKNGNWELGTEKKKQKKKSSFKQHISIRFFPSSIAHR
jgi:ribosomal protein S21